MNTLRQPLLREITTALLMAVLLLQSATAVAPGPAWWSAQNVADPYAIPDDFAVANAGQLKYLAAKAAAAMNAELPGGAGETINTMIAAWNASPAQGVTRDNYLAINQGQLKQVAAPFYERLGLPYPWAGSSGLRDDFLLVNLGQLKHVFSFELKFRTVGQGPVQIPAATLQAALDAWNALGPAKPLGSTAEDLDGDGISNLQEYLMGNALFDPLDLDGDRIADMLEDASGGILSKLRFADAVEDHDNDGVMNFEEVKLGLNLNAASSSGRADGLTDAEVLAWGLAAGTPLAPSTDAVRALWERIDAEWLDANVGGDYYLYWLNEADANNDNVPDGLSAFRSDVANFVWQPSAIWRAAADDCDGDGMSDLWEYRYALDLRDGQGDTDGDGLSNMEEYAHGTNPRLADSDGDGFDDGAEYSQGGDPTNGATGLPLVLTLVSGAVQAVYANSASAPLAVRVTQGGQPVLGAVVMFAVSTGGGSLRSGAAAATTGTQVALATGSDGIASATYQAGATEGSAGVTAALAADSAQSVGFTLAVTAAPVTYTFGAPFGGGAVGGFSSGSVLSNPFEEVTLLVGYKWMNASYGYVTYQDQKRYAFSGDIGDLYRMPSFVAAYQETEDKRAQVKQRFEQERFSYMGGPLAYAWIPTVAFSRHYDKVTDSPYVDDRESDYHYRSAVALKVQRYVAQAEQPEVAVLAMVYRDEENTGYTPDPRDPSKLKASGVIRVKGSASTWSPSLNAYCQKKGDAVIVDAVAESIPEKTNGYAFIDLFPLELAPEKLASNGDFDEGETGGTAAQETGALADNRNRTLIAKRDSVDGRVETGDFVTDDLHQGWFGLRPGVMPDDFFDGANVTISKKEKTDPSTGKPESGNVRFFATWGDKQELAIRPDDSSIDPILPPDPAAGNLVGKVYGTNKTVPSGATFWIEGVSPGKITLEYRIQKGSTDIKHEQTFEICNDWTKAQWLSVVRDEIYLDSFTSSSGAAKNGFSNTGIDMNQYVVANGFLPNRLYIYSVYEYYAKLHDKGDGETATGGGDKFLWAGLAKLAGAPVYGGMSDAQNGRDGSLVVAGTPLPFGTTLGVVSAATLMGIQDLLIDANINIYNDLAYQFVAYRTGGLKSLEHLNKIGEIRDDNYNAWKLIDGGEATNVASGNQQLLQREQQVILAQTYTDLLNMWDGWVADAFSWLTRNPIVGGPSFQTVIPNGNIAVFADRWGWITHPQQGMWLLWTSKDKYQRQSLANSPLRTNAANFAFFSRYSLAPLR